MKCAGIIGGIAPESTIEYYGRIVARHRERAAGAYPSLLINSIDLTKLLGLVASGQLDALVAYLRDELTKLARAGADFGALASNTPHIVFDDLQRLSPIPLTSIVEAAAAFAARRQYRRVGLFGTRFTMRGGFYTNVFARHGITIVLPNEAEQDYVNGKYIGDFANGRYTGEFVNGIFLPETRDGLHRIARAMIDRDQIEALVLGGTELPLILRDEHAAGIPLIDTTNIHVAAIVSELLR